MRFWFTRMKVEKWNFFLPFVEGRQKKAFISAFLLISASQLAFLDCQPFGCFQLTEVTWTQPCYCQFNHCLMPRIYNKVKEKEFNFMSSFHLQKRCITVYKIYWIMWQDTWLMHCFEELRITLWEMTHYSPVPFSHHDLNPLLWIFNVLLLPI